MPVECLHTILLGPVKYFLDKLLNRLNEDEKEVVRCKIDSFCFSGIDENINGRSICA